MSEFFAMGGYAAYVWPAFIITAVVLIGNVAHAGYQLRKAKRLTLRV